MYTCPICGEENPYYLCKGCGFDISCDYEHYPTLSKVNSQALVISNLKKTYENKQKKYISCKNCGGKSFYIDQETHECICTQCSKPLEIKYQDKSPVQNQTQNKNSADSAEFLNENLNKDLYKNSKQFQNQNNVTNAVREANELFILCQKQKGGEKVKTAEKIKTLFEKYSFNSELAVLYAKALKNLSLTLTSKEKTLTASELEKLHKKFKYNELIAFVYAETLASMSVTQDYKDKQKTVIILESLHSHFRDSGKIASAYVWGLMSLMSDQNIRERQETLFVIKDVYEKFKNNVDIAVIYALMICNVCKFQRKTNLRLGNHQETTDAKSILENLRSKFPQNKNIRQCCDEINEMSRY